VEILPSQEEQPLRFAELGPGDVGIGGSVVVVVVVGAGVVVVGAGASVVVAGGWFGCEKKNLVEYIYVCIHSWVFLSAPESLATPSDRYASLSDLAKKSHLL
jgi:hypothetical protein